ncbi:MAG: peptide chain release factor-like protein, partial [Pseudomonadota bacterium]
VNRTDSAVRITHIPSGIVVQCQNDRSQHRNRAQAMDMLRAKLYEAELRRREEEAQAAADEKSDIAWGHQIRSYVFQPYQMVKDLRTGVETGNVNAVMDGDLDQFLEASLAARVTDKRVEEEAAG